MLKQIKIVLIMMLASGSLSSMHAAVTSITKIELKDILENNKHLPIYIDSAKFGSDDVTNKVQYHAARGLLYIPFDAREKMINFSIADKKYSLSLKANTKLFELYLLSATNYIVNNDITYNDSYLFSANTVYLLPNNGYVFSANAMQLLNRINRGASYNYTKAIKRTMVYSLLGGYQERRENVDLSYLQKNFGDEGIIPSTIIDIMKKIEGNPLGSAGQKKSYKITFKIRIDNRDITYDIEF